MDPVANETIIVFIVVGVLVFVSSVAVRFYLYKVHQNRKNLEDLELEFSE